MPKPLKVECSFRPSDYARVHIQHNLLWLDVRNSFSTTEATIGLNSTKARALAARLVEFADYMDKGEEEAAEDVI